MAATDPETNDVLEGLGGVSLVQALLEGAPTGLLLVDEQYSIRYANPAFLKWVRQSNREAIGQKCYTILFGHEKPCEDGGAGCPAAATLGSGRPAGPVTFLRQTPAGRKQYLRVHAHPVPSGPGSPSQAVAFIQDVTSEKLLKDYKEEASLRDPLTGLYNRQGFDHLLKREFKRTRRQGHPLSLCLIDLDAFKDYNDKKGQKTGDALLTRLAGILVAQTRVGVDALCRLQADTFALILPEASHDQALGIGHRIRHAAEEDRIPISLSMAIRQPEDSEAPDAFYHRTADALFQAKKNGGDKIL